MLALQSNSHEDNGVHIPRSATMLSTSLNIKLRTFPRANSQIRSLIGTVSVRCIDCTLTITKRGRFAEPDISRSQRRIDICSSEHLSRRELCHTLIERVVHVVVDIVETRQRRTCVKGYSRTTSSCVSLVVSVINEVSWSVTRAGEDVEKTEPVADFMDGC